MVIFFGRGMSVIVSFYQLDAKTIGAAVSALVLDSAGVSFLLPWRPTRSRELGEKTEDVI